MPQNLCTWLVTLVAWVATEKVHLAPHPTEKMGGSLKEVGYIWAGFRWLQHLALRRLCPPGPWGRHQVACIAGTQAE